jgi:hypothetical protein
MEGGGRCCVWPPAALGAGAARMDLIQEISLSFNLVTNSTSPVTNRVMHAKFAFSCLLWLAVQEA